MKKAEKIYKKTKETDELNLRRDFEWNKIFMTSFIVILFIRILDMIKSFLLKLNSLLLTGLL